MALESTASLISEPLCRHFDNLYRAFESPLLQVSYNHIRSVQAWGKNWWMRGEIWRGNCDQSLLKGATNAPQNMIKKETWLLRSFSADQNHEDANSECQETVSKEREWINHLFIATRLPPLPLYHHSQVPQPNYKEGEHYHQNHSFHSPYHDVDPLSNAVIYQHQVHFPSPYPSTSQP